MKKLLALAVVLASLLGAAQPTLAAADKKQKPMKHKPVEKARRHNHRESMQRVHKDQRERMKDSK